MLNVCIMKSATVLIFTHIQRISRQNGRLEARGVGGGSSVESKFGGGNYISLQQIASHVLKIYQRVTLIQP